MDIRYDEYEYVILDAAALLYPLDEGLWPALQSLSQSRKLYAASTLRSDIREFRAAFRDLVRCYPDEYNRDRMDQLDQNIQELNRREIIFCIFNYTDYDPDMESGPHHDTWSLVNSLKNRKTLLVTGSETLFQRVLLDDGISVDLLFMDPEYKNRLITPPMREGFKRLFELDKERVALYCQFQEETNPKLYDQDGKEVLLRAMVNNHGAGERIEGTESWIYEDESDHAAAKIYKINDDDADFIEGLQGNIRKMARFAGEGYYPWVMFPTKLLYMERPTEDNPSPPIVGYGMRESAFFKTFVNMSRFTEVTRASYGETLKLLQTTLRRVMILDSVGILILDFNWNNFWNDLDWRDVRFLDACSFSFRTYTNKCRSRFLQPLVNYKRGDRHLYDKIQLIQEHLDLTHLFLASLLMCGQTVEAKDGRLNFLQEGDALERYFVKLVPPNLKQLFRFLYQDHPGTGPFSLEILLEELSRAVRAIGEKEATTEALFDVDGPLEEPELFREYTFSEFDDDLTVKCEEVEWPYDEGNDRTEEENHTASRKKATPRQKRTPQMRQRVYLPRKEHLPVRNVMANRDPSTHLSRRGRSTPDPLPPVYQWGKQSRPVLRTLLFALAAVLALTAADALHFSGSDLGFSFPLYVDDRLELIAQWLQELFGTLMGMLPPG